MLMILAAGTVFPGRAPEGFITNRTLLIGFVVALILAFLAKLFFRSHDARQLARRQENQEAAAISRDGPPTFNG